MSIRKCRKTDCFGYREDSLIGCDCLATLYGKNQQCSFYKSKKDRYKSLEEALNRGKESGKENV